jgi:hydrogenase maturation protease
MTESAAILVLGLGNILLGDEGVGVRTVEALLAGDGLPAAVTVVDGGTCGMDLLDLIAQARHLIVIDAVRTGRAPAELVRLEGETLPVFFCSKLSPHQTGLGDLLATLALHGQAPETVVVFGCEPVCLDLGLELSPAVAARVPELAAQVRQEVGRRLALQPPGAAGAAESE